MTLNITVVTPWGIWQSSDHRLTALPKRDRYDDDSVKANHLHCRDGTVLITYAGIGRLGVVHVSDWIQGLLRGEHRTVDENLIMIREGSDEWLAKPASREAIHHTFTIGAYIQGAAWVAMISNILPKPPFQEELPLDHFETSGMRVESSSMVLITGERRAVQTRDSELLRRVAEVRSKNPKDFSKLLASVNERASRHPRFGRVISPGCITSYMPPEGHPVQSEVHNGGLKSPTYEPVLPSLIYGADMTEMVKVMVRQLKLQEDGNVTPEQEAEHQRAIDEAGRRSVEPVPRFPH